MVKKYSLRLDSCPSAFVSPRTYLILLKLIACISKTLQLFRLGIVAKSLAEWFVETKGYGDLEIQILKLGFLNH